MNIIQEIYETLSNDTVITNIVSDRLFPVIITKDNVISPLIVFSKIDSEREYYKENRCGRIARLQANKCYAEHYAGVTLSRY